MLQSYLVDMYSTRLCGRSNRKGAVLRPISSQKIIHQRTKVLSRLMHSAAVVHLARVDQLLAAADGDLLRVKLVRQGLVRRLDRVQGALGTGHLGGQVVDARGTAHLEDTVGAAETEACGLRSMLVNLSFFV